MLFLWSDGKQRASLPLAGGSPSGGVVGCRLPLGLALARGMGITSPISSLSAPHGAVAGLAVVDDLAWVAHTGQALVVGAVAVVVFTIAAFLAGCRRRSAERLPALAYEETSALGAEAHHLVGVTEVELPGEALVDLLITVVVLTVAEFDDGGITPRVAEGRPRSIFAGDHAEPDQEKKNELHRTPPSITSHTVMYLWSSIFM